jgi:hypothetical protein
MSPKPMPNKLAVSVRSFDTVFGGVAEDATLAVDTRKNEIVEVMIRKFENRSRKICWGSGMAPVSRFLDAVCRAD